jgi:hypothetical protein
MKLYQHPADNNAEFMLTLKSIINVTSKSHRVTISTPVVTIKVARIRAYDCARATLRALTLPELAKESRFFTKEAHEPYGFWNYLTGGMVANLFEWGYHHSFGNTTAPTYFGLLGLINFQAPADTRHEIDGKTILEKLTDNPVLLEAIKKYDLAGYFLLGRYGFNHGTFQLVDYGYPNAIRFLYCHHHAVRRALSFFDRGVVLDLRPRLERGAQAI